MKTIPYILGAIFLRPLIVLAAIFGLLFVVSTRAQMLQDIAQDVHHSSGGGCVGALDSLPTPLSAYSTRLLKGTYTGFAFQLERASDSTTHDIGFVSCNLDTSTISTFCAATTCAFSKWYDQYGNMDWSQPTSANQPPYDSTCSTLLNSKPCTTMTSGYWMTGVSGKIDMASTDQTVMFVFNSGNNTGYTFLSDDSSGTFVGWETGNGINVSNFTQGLFQNGKGSWVEGNAITNANHVAGYIRTAGSVVFYIDGTTSAAITGMGNSASGIAPVLFADTSHGRNYVGSLAEVVIVDSAWSNTNYSTYRTGTQSWFGTP